MRRNNMKKLCLVAFALLAAGNAVAGTQTWDFGNSQDSLSGSDSGNELVLRSGSGGDQVTLTVSAWASTDECDDDDDKLCVEEAELRKWSSGLGIVNENEDDDVSAPDHAIDNVRDSDDNDDDQFEYEMVLLSFSSEVNLTELNIGWSWCRDSCSSYRDADMSVLVHDGSAVNFFNAQTKWSDIAHQGWSVIDNYSNLKDDVDVVVNQPQYSKHWLVGAFNRVFGDNWTINNDAFKLAGLSTVTRETNEPEPVSAPATLGLFGLLTLILLQRRKK